MTAIIVSSLSIRPYLNHRNVQAAPARNGAGSTSTVDFAFQILLQMELLVVMEQENEQLRCFINYLTNITILTDQLGMNKWSKPKPASR